jgi:hypothetical protein
MVWRSKGWNDPVIVRSLFYYDAPLEGLEAVVTKWDDGDGVAGSMASSGTQLHHSVCIV